MKYVLLIHQGDAPTPYEETWSKLSAEEQQEISQA